DEPETFIIDGTPITLALDTQSETTLVLGAEGRIVVAYNDTGSTISGNGRLEATGYSVSSDGGQTFQDMGGLPDNPFGSYSDPVLARRDRTGTIFLAILSRYNLPGDPPIVAQDHINIFRSIDNGVTFEAPVNSAPGFVPEVDENDKEWLA